MLGSGSRSLSSTLPPLFNQGGIPHPPLSPNRSVRQFVTASRQITSTSTRSSARTTWNTWRSIVQVMRGYSSVHGGQVFSQLGNTLGTLAASFPTVANVMLFPNGTTASPDPGVSTRRSTGNRRTLLNTTAMQLGMALSVFGGTSQVISQLEPMLFGSTSNLNGLAASLQNLSFGSTDFNWQPPMRSTAASTTFSSFPSIRFWECSESNEH